jgi:predicted metalloendopeptidase
MGSERDYLQNISKIKDQAAKRSNQVSDIFVKMHKQKSEAIKRNEEMLSKARSDMAKLEKKINGDKDLAPESKQRLSREIVSARPQFQSKYDELRRRIDQTEIQ